MTTKPVFVILTSDSCGHCEDFKRDQREKLMNLLKTVSNMIEIVESARLV